MGCIGDSLQSKCAQRREQPENFEYFRTNVTHTWHLICYTHTVLSQSFTPYPCLFHKLVHKGKTEQKDSKGGSLLTDEDSDNDRDDDNSDVDGRKIWFLSKGQLIGGNMR